MFKYLHVFHIPLHRTIEDADSRVVQFHLTRIQYISDIALYKNKQEILLCDQLDRTKRRIMGFAKSLVVKLSETSYKSSPKKVELAEDLWQTHLLNAEIVGIGSCELSVVCRSVPELLLEDSFYYFPKCAQALETVILTFNQSGAGSDHDLCRNQNFLVYAAKLSTSALMRLRDEIESIDSNGLFIPTLFSAIKVLRKILEMGACLSGIVDFEYCDIACTAELLCSCSEYWMDEVISSRKQQPQPSAPEHRDDSLVGTEPPQEGIYTETPAPSSAISRRPMSTWLLPICGTGSEFVASLLVVSRCLLMTSPVYSLRKEPSQEENRAQTQVQRSNSSSQGKQYDTHHDIHAHRQHGSPSSSPEATYDLKLYDATIERVMTRRFIRTL